MEQTRFGRAHGHTDNFREFIHGAFAQVPKFKNGPERWPKLLDSVSKSCFSFFLQASLFGIRGRVSGEELVVVLRITDCNRIVG